ncbi:MAG: hypothetical protein ACYDHH_11180 [Solirubrobacteraceae bacterium]
MSKFALTTRLVLVAALASLAVLAAQVALAAPPPRAAVSTGRHQASASCPKRDPGSKTSRRPGAAAALVPSGAVALRLCLYNTIGLPQQGAVNGLISTRAITAPGTIAGIASKLNALAPPSRYPLACTLELSDNIVAYFSYGGGPANPVAIQPYGCLKISNGRLVRYGNRTLVDQIHALIPSPRVPLGPGPVVISTIAGELQVCGGPAPGRCRVENFTICGPPSGCVTADRVLVVRDGAKVASARLRHGRFSVIVQPERYTVELLGDGRRVHGNVLQQKTVNAAKWRTTRVKFGIEVPRPL